MAEPEDKVENEAGEEGLLVVFPEGQDTEARLDSLQEMINDMTKEANLIQELEEVSLNDHAEAKSEETPNPSNKKDFHQVGSD